VSLLSFSFARELTQHVPAVAGFLCDSAAELGEGTYNRIAVCVDLVYLDLKGACRLQLHLCAENL
jgi:hypothetical protein